MTENDWKEMERDAKVLVALLADRKIAGGAMWHLAVCDVVERLGWTVGMRTPGDEIRRKATPDPWVEWVGWLGAGVKS